MLLMKKWFFISAALILLMLAGFIYLKKSAIKKLPSNHVLSAVVLPASLPVILKQSTVINVSGVSTRVSWAIVNPEDIELYSNLKDQHLSEQIKADRNCRILVNGGFYSEEGTNLGLLITDSEIISPFSKSTTRNGILAVDGNHVSIGNDLTVKNPRIGLQSGPLLMQNGQPLALKINNDEPNRRIVAGTTKDNKLIFLAFYSDESDLEGPLLGLMPEAVDLFKKQTGINITDAINLDGGSASVFITDYVVLRELNHMGSYFCIR